MSNAPAKLMCRGFKIGFLLFAGACINGLAADLRNSYDADEAVLAELRNSRMESWVGFQLDLMRSRYSSRKDDIEFLDALYARTMKLRSENLEKIPSSNSRYGEAQFQAALNKTSAQERYPLLKRAYEALKGKRDKADLLAQVQRHYLAALVELRKIKEALVVIKESGNSDKRYLEYQSARLQLMSADDELEEKGVLSAATKAMVANVISALTTGKLFWQLDMMAMLGYCELAHANILLNKPKDAIKTISSSFAQISKYDDEFKGERSIYSPKIVAIYYLAKAYALHAKHVKSGTSKPPKGRIREGGKVVVKELSKDEGVKLFLTKAFNIMQKDLQVKHYRKSRYSKQALRDLDDIRKDMVAEGMSVPKLGKDQIQMISREKAYEFYKDKNYKEAVEQFLISSKGMTGGEDFRNDLFYISASYCYLNDFDKAKDYAFKCIKYFEKDARAWQAIHNVGIKAKLAAKALRETKPEEAKKLLGLASEMYMKIANENPNYPQIASVLWQAAMEKWTDAGALSARKKELSLKIKKLKNANPGAPEIKSMTTELNTVIADIKTEYLEAIPFFQKLIDNYTNTEFGVSAIYRIGWIYYINEDKPKAIEYLLRFCEKSNGVSADYLDAKYIAADLLFRNGDMDEAEKLFKEVIAESAPDKIDLSNKSVANRVKRFKTGSKALLPWIYDRKGEELLDDAQSMLDQNDELNGLIGEYEVAINKNKDENEATLKLPRPIPPAIPANASKTFTPGTLPADFAFASFLDQLKITVDLMKALPADITVSFKDNLLWFSKNYDTIGCAGGNGFRVSIKGRKVSWKSEKVACYRDGKLVCLYDPSTLQAMPAKEGEAPAEISLPEISQDIPAQELELRFLFLQKQVDANQDRYKTVRKEGLALQRTGLSGMQEFLVEYPKNKVFSPGILLRMATIHVSLEDWIKAEEYISKLQARFPKSAEADKSPIYLFRILMNAYEKELDPDKKKALLERAQSQAKAIADSITKQSKGNINLLAFKLFKSDGKGGLQSMSPELADAALDEVLSRGQDTSHPDHGRFSRLREKAILFKGMVLDAQGNYDKGIAQIDILLKENPQSAYLFKAMTLKAQMQRKAKKYNDAKRTIGEVATKASGVRERFKREYWLAILEFGKIYAAVDSKASYKAAKTPLEQCIKGLREDEKELQDIRESAYFELFRVHKKLGDTQKALTLQNEYLRAYPAGAFASDFSKVK
ncbi:hypothetical protein BVX99_02690 [bacterium F16]|nr:hypothetical protein BVX99_02690 [bacterium F16]